MYPRFCREGAGRAARLAVLALGGLLSGAGALAAQEFRPGHLFATILPEGAILEFDRAGQFVGRFAEDVAFTSIARLAFGPDGRLYVADAAADRVVVLDATGAEVDSLEALELGFPIDVAFGPGGHAYVTSLSGSSIVEFDAVGGFVRSMPTGALSTPSGLCFGPNGHLYVKIFPAPGEAAVLEFDPQGALVRELASDPGLPNVGDIVINDEGLLLVTSAENDNVFKVDASGAVVDFFGDPALDTPIFCIALRADGAVLVGGESGQLLITDETGTTATPIPLPAEVDPDSDVVGLAFAPYRFEARVNGALVRDGLKPITRKERGVLAWYPGSSGAFLVLDDTPSESDFVSASGGLRTFVLHGLPLRDDVPGKRSRFTGLDIADATLGRGWASTAFQASGKPVHGQFAPAKIAGRFRWVAPGLGFGGNLSTGKLLK